MKKISRIIVHHSASDWGTANIIRGWHVTGNAWRDIGYHFVISNGIPTYADLQAGRCFESMVGQVEYGRALDADPWLAANEVGAHAYGFNSDSIGICLIHKSGAYDKRMLAALMNLIEDLCRKFEINPARVIGHYEVESGKPMCPSIKMDVFRTQLKARLS